MHTGQLLRENFRRGSICGFGKIASLEQGSVQFSHGLGQKAQAVLYTIQERGIEGEDFSRLQAPVMVFLHSAMTGTRGRHIPYKTFIKSLRHLERINEFIRASETQRAFSSG